MKSILPPKMRKTWWMALLFCVSLVAGSCAPLSGILGGEEDESVPPPQIRSQKRIPMPPTIREFQRQRELKSPRQQLTAPPFDEGPISLRSDK